MLKKKISACLLMFVLLFLTSCGGYKASDVMTVVGDKEGRDPLRICLDFGENVPDIKGLNDFVYRLKHTAGIEEVVIEIVPPYNISQGLWSADTVERETVLTRLRTEVMAGEGPDVFLMQYEPYKTIGVYLENDYEGTDCLFKYPEKAMENGLFLPLDEYIENNAEFAEWDKLTQSVLDAGRNEEGLQIVPLDYSLPLLCISKNDWEYDTDRQYNWQDMLTNPELLPYSLDLANCGEAFYDTDTKKDIWLSEQTYIHRILGELADYENETLLFTEEELFALTNEILSLERVDSYKDLERAKVLPAGPKLSVNTYNQPVTFLPLYNKDGGITAHIRTFAAVSRNTKRPEDAFKVIDLLMNKDFQANSSLYFEILGASAPMNEELLNESAPVNYDKYMIAENFEAFCKVREQITAANFRSEITVMLEEMFNKCFQAEKYEMTVEEIVHETYEHLERRIKE